MDNIEEQIFEEHPLHNFRTKYHKPRQKSLKGPLRVVKLCIFGIVLPAFLVALPLYLKYHVYSSQLYPIAISDMRLLDRRISTVWCQKQIVKANATFNAFVLPNKPNVSPEQKPQTMVRELHLEDDMKEYWGFYLLSGSAVTVSTCVRWPGSSLIIIQGHKHLHECAYIGDDSSEESDEFGDISEETSNHTLNLSNFPFLMKRHTPDVKFHHAYHDQVKDDFHLKENMKYSDETDPKLLKILLDSLATKNKRINHGDKINKTKKYESIKDFNKNKVKNLTSEEVFADVWKKLDALGDRKHRVLEKLNSKASPANTNTLINRLKRREVILKSSLAKDLNEAEESENLAIEEGFVPDEIADHRGFINETTPNDGSYSEFWSSFSSSEEALLNCKGLILNLPLTPHHRCHRNETEQQLEDAAQTNTITYIVPENGYYFFVFNSENEIQVNYIRVRFKLNRTTYDISQPVSSCSNNSGQCDLNLNFFSNEKTVIEVPAVLNESRWNDEFVVISECQPRTMIYACFVVAVPIVIIFFAFQ